jgi:hypothetical protein
MVRRFLRSNDQNLPTISGNSHSEHEPLFEHHWIESCPEIEQIVFGEVAEPQNEANSRAIEMLHEVYPFGIAIPVCH